MLLKAANVSMIEFPISLADTSQSSAHGAVLWLKCSLASNLGGGGGRLGIWLLTCIHGQIMLHLQHNSKHLCSEMSLTYFCVICFLVGVFSVTGCLL